MGRAWIYTPEWAGALLRDIEAQIAAGTLRPAEWKRRKPRPPRYRARSNSFDLRAIRASLEPLTVKSIVSRPEPRPHP
jgi:hypothetical protein